jgi:4-hydroxy-tetrahydrodipicolinate synthase
MPPLQGPLAALVTTRRPAGHTIDIGPSLDILDFLATHGVAGVALLGATGEFVHFDFEERMRFAHMAIRRSRVPLLVNVSHSTLEGALTLARDAANSGAAGLLLMPPYFFRYKQAELLEFYLRFADAAAGLPPTFLYNLPFFTNGLESATACAILATGRFAGIKDSSGNLDLFAALAAQRARQSFTLFIGNDSILAARREACDGVISGCACAVPELIVGIDRAVALGNADGLGRLGKRLGEFIGMIDPFPTPLGVQEALALRGFPAALAPTRLGPELQAHRAQFRSWFPNWLVSMQADVKAI